MMTGRTRSSSASSPCGTPTCPSSTGRARSSVSIIGPKFGEMFSRRSLHFIW
ncbi:putative ribosome-binding factor A, chloroplastic [Iris pallida]|uniref:Ribosome-binding factor A, chloroplastic n=1 Tax=Iris pallida TaxID=29817 RepID=A0AAX6H884_IRIPA|nr:putative ribosome-binding factor A, chloroplastic [Iris pallida]